MSGRFPSKSVTIISGISSLLRQADTAPSAAIKTPVGIDSLADIPAPTMVTCLLNIISDKFPSALYNLEIKRDDTFSRDFEKPNWELISS